MMENAVRRTLVSDWFWGGLTLALMLAASAAVAIGLMFLPPPVVAAGLLALLAGALILWTPFLGVLLFLALLYTRPEQFFPQLAALRLPLLLASLTLFAWLVQVLRRRETLRWRAESGWMAAFAASMALSAFQVPGTGHVMSALVDAARLLVMYLLIQQVLNTEGRARLALGWLIALNAILALISIHGWWTGSALVDRGRVRALVRVGDFDDPNDLAAALVAAAPLAIAAAFQARSALARAASAAAAGALVAAIFLCDSRGGYLALGVGMAVLLAGRIGWARAALVAALAAGLILTLAPFVRSYPGLAQDDSALGRVAAWQAGLSMLERSPLLGAGYDQFEQRHVIPAHNSLVHAVGEGGLLNAVAWVGLNYWAVLTLLRLGRRTAGDVKGMGGARGDPVGVAYAGPLLACVLASLTAQMFLSHAYRPVPLIPLALVAALGALQKTGTPAADRVHYALVPAVTAVAIGLVYFAVALLL